jgi:hypothetical protein
VRLAADRQITHLTAINSRWLLDRDGQLVASRRDGRTLRPGRDDVADRAWEACRGCGRPPTDSARSDRNAIGV